MRVTPVRPTELGAADLTHWRRMLRAGPAPVNPFLSAEFAVAVGRARSSARVAVIDDGASTAGFFAYELHGRRTAVPVGAGLGSRQGVVHRPGLDWDARELLRGCGISGWDFDGLPIEQVPARACDVVALPSAVIDLERGFATYLDDRRRGNRGVVDKALKKRRQMEREVGPVRFDLDVRDRSCLNTLMRWKSAQYARLATDDRFADPGIVAIVNELYESRAPECTGTLSVLHAGDNVIAISFSLRSETILSGWFPAYDPTMSKYSPGTVLRLSMAEGAAERRLLQYDLGTGRSDMKDALKTRDVIVARGSVDAAVPRALVRRMRRLPRTHIAPMISASPWLRQRIIRARDTLAHRVGSDR